MIYPKLNSLRELQELLEQQTEPDLLEDIKNAPIDTLKKMVQKPDEQELDKYKITSVPQLASRIDEETVLHNLIRYDPVRIIHQLARQSPRQPQFRVYILLVALLCSIVAMTMIGVLVKWIIYKSYSQTPPLLIAIACTSLGLLAGIFVAVPGKAGGKE